MSGNDWVRRWLDELARDPVCCTDDVDGISPRGYDILARLFEEAASHEPEEDV
jgi:hypothetical protein